MHHDAQPALRLLLLVDTLDLGGAERHVVDLAGALRRRGHEVEVGCSAGGPLEQDLREADVPVRILTRRPVKRAVSRPLAHAVRCALRQGHFDLVHAHMFASAVAAGVAAYDTGLPLVITEHSDAAWRSPVQLDVSRRLYARAARIIAVSASVAERLRRVDGVPPECISVIPNAVPSAPSWPPEVRPGSHPLVGVVARLQSEKSVDVFLEAAAGVAARCPSSSFVVVGDGPLRRFLEGSARRLGIADRVSFLGARRDARALIRCLDVLVVPSLSEGAPLVTLEAMTAGVPVVASAVGGIAEQIRNGVDGLLVPPGDAVALREAILALLHDSARAEALGEAGRHRVAGCFSHDRLVSCTEHVYRAVRLTPVIDGTAAQSASPATLPRSSRAASSGR